MNKKILALTLLLGLFTLTACESKNNFDEPVGARYRLTFTTTWSAETHPTQFPSNRHFSGLIGVTHTSANTFWNTGSLASGGIEMMAERGAKEGLLAEFELAGLDSDNVISGGGISVDQTSVSVEFVVEDIAPLVTVVSMLAPSPDWFVGVSGLALFENGEFVDTKTITLRVYDAGTDSGVTFASANADTSPAQAISRLTSDSADSDFENGLPSVATFTFTKL